MYERLLTRLFRYEEINGAHRCPTYLHRWTLFQPRWPKKLWRGFGIYLHKFVGDDWSRDESYRCHASFVELSQFESVKEPSRSRGG